SQPDAVQPRQPRRMMMSDLADGSTWPTWPQWTDADLDAVRRVLDTGRWNGVDAPAVTELERRWAEQTGARHALAAAIGTDTLLLALRALGVGPGDEVIVPPYTFLATASAVLLA